MNIERIALKINSYSYYVSATDPEDKRHGEFYSNYLIKDKDEAINESKEFLNKLRSEHENWQFYRIVKASPDGPYPEIEIDNENILSLAATTDQEST